MITQNLIIGGIVHIFCRPHRRPDIHCCSKMRIVLTRHKDSAIRTSRYKMGVGGNVCELDSQLKEGITSLAKLFTTLEIVS